MPATAAWLGSAEALLNRYIGASAQARAIAQRLQGTSLQVDVEGITRIRAAVFHGRLALLTGDDSSPLNATEAVPPASAAAPPNAVISGSPPALLQLMRGGVNRAPARAAAQIRGDAEIANLYRELFMLARPDLEEELSRFVGDLAARRLSQFAHGAIAFGRRVRRTAGENIAEYLQEEIRDLVNKPELEEFLRGVDDVRETTDRIEARLARLEQRTKSAT
jgi:ubiquinone biosynthesis protein UbiJ